MSVLDDSDEKDGRTLEIFSANKEIYDHTNSKRFHVAKVTDPFTACLLTTNGWHKE